MEYQNDDWGRKGATLSDKTASAECRLTHDELVTAIRAGKLQYRQGSMHGNPWLRLLRCEVEELAQAQRGESESGNSKRAELARINRELRQHRTQLTRLEKRQAELLADLGD
jgi:hypothetical protein